MPEPNPHYENLSREELVALREDTLVLIRKVGDLGETSVVNDRTTTFPKRSELLQQLADIARAISIKDALAAGRGGPGYARSFVDSGTRA